MAESDALSQTADSLRSDDRGEVVCLIKIKPKVDEMVAGKRTDTLVIPIALAVSGILNPGDQTKNAG